jgi:hypothetical protein
MILIYEPRVVLENCGFKCVRTKRVMIVKSCGIAADQKHTQMKRFGLFVLVLVCFAFRLAQDYPKETLRWFFASHPDRPDYPMVKGWQASIAGNVIGMSAPC